MFFPRLRRQAKWAFVFLAAVFAVGFVAFGVGSDVPGGIADVLGQGSGGTGQPSVSDAREKLEKNPRDAQALRDLATALQTEGRTEEAIEPLERYARLRPRDQGALTELATLYVTRANRFRGEVEQIQLEAQTLLPGSEFQPPATTPLGQALANQPIAEAVTTQASARLNASITKLRDAAEAAKRTYQRIARLSPGDASIQIQLASAAQDAGDTATAIAAYRRFLKLAPDDPNARIVRQEIARLQAFPSTGATALGG